MARHTSALNLMTAERNGFSRHFAKARYLVNNRSAYSGISGFVTTASLYQAPREADNYFTDLEFLRLKDFHASYIYPENITDPFLYLICGSLISTNMRTSLFSSYQILL